MISYRRTSQGAWELSADVTHPSETFTWTEYRQFFYYTKAGAAKAFREYLKTNGFTIRKGY